VIGLSPIQAAAIVCNNLPFREKYVIEAWMFIVLYIETETNLDIEIEASSHHSPFSVFLYCPNLYLVEARRIPRIFWVEEGKHNVHHCCRQAAALSSDAP
jgi:hypothetical protein